MGLLGLLEAAFQYTREPQCHENKKAGSIRQDSLPDKEEVPGSNPGAPTSDLQGNPAPTPLRPGPSAILLQPKCLVVDGTERDGLRLVVAPCPPRLLRLHDGWRLCPAGRQRATEATELTQPTDRRPVMKRLSRTTVSCGTSPPSRVCGYGSRPGRGGWACGSRTGRGRRRGCGAP